MNQYPIFPGQDTPARPTLRLPVLTTTVSTELSHDFTLPDYLPDIRKILRVSATILPQESYVGSTSVDFSGALQYKLLYVSADGTLWSGDLPADYALSLPLSLSERFDPTVGIDAFEATCPEQMLTRVLSPRKVSIRTRLASTVEVYAEASLDDKLRGQRDEHIERLEGEGDCAVVLRGRQSGLTLTDEILPSGEKHDALRVISAEGQVFVSEADADSDTIRLRGEAVVRIFTAEDEENAMAAAPTVLLRRIPFDTAIAVVGADRFADARGFGEIERIGVTVEDGRILCEAVLTLFGECQKNRRFVYTRDLFSTAAEVDTVYETLRLPIGVKCGVGNFTFSESTPLEGVGIGADDRIIDVTGSFSIGQVTVKNDRLLCTGEGDFRLLLHNDVSGEYSAVEISLPYRYLTDYSADLHALPEEITEASLLVTPITLRCKTDGERLAVEGELSVSLRASASRTETMLCEAHVGSPLLHERGTIRIYYPVKEETLWEAARRYHVSPRALAAASEIALAPSDRLDGVKFLTVVDA